MRLANVYDYGGSERILWDLLLEREPHVNISHHDMPSWDAHCAFIESRPYREWYIVLGDRDVPVGACYLSRWNEIGVFIFSKHRHNGYGPTAVMALMLRHADERLLANVSPNNPESRKLFEGLGFRHIQDTLEFVNPVTLCRERTVVNED